MSEPVRASTVWREALTLIVRHPVATVAPAPVVPVVAFASLAAIALPTASASLLVIPGIWVMTRWSLFTPVIVTEHLGPVAALKRSNELVRGNFELVFLTAAFAVVLEEAVAAAGSVVGHALTGSESWGEWSGGSVATLAVLPVASFATALVYGHLRHLEERT